MAGTLPSLPHACLHVLDGDSFTFIGYVELKYCTIPVGRTVHHKVLNIERL